MALPKLQASFYQVRLPSNNQIVSYRPFLVGEEKILLLAAESDDKNEQLRALKQIIQNCIQDSKIVVDSLPLFDLEYLFLKIRCKSVGEVVHPSIKCEKCKAKTSIRIDLSKIEPVTSPEHTNRIPIDDNIGLIMRYPTVEMFEKSVDLPANTSNTQLAFATVANCIEKVYDKESVFNLHDESKEEIDKFLNSLPRKTLTDIEKFFETAPKIEHSVDYKCSDKNCAFDGKVEFKSVYDFFV